MDDRVSWLRCWDTSWLTQISAGEQLAQCILSLCWCANANSPLELLLPVLPVWGYLWSRVSRHQTLQLQCLSLSDGVNSLTVALLLHVTGLTWVHDAHSRGRCGGQQHRDNTFNMCVMWLVRIITVEVKFVSASCYQQIQPIRNSCFSLTKSNWKLCTLKVSSKTSHTIRMPQTTRFFPNITKMSLLRKQKHVFPVFLLTRILSLSSL